MTEQELTKQIEIWFNNNSNNPNKWNRGAGLAIKNNLISLGNWKNAPRGNPKAGYEKMMENKYENYN